MSDNKRQNKGFTLIELIIAIAMLAFLMTAVSAFMVSGIVSFKKTKADVRVHNSAQENYDKVSDAIMEAKDIYLFGYEAGSDELYCFVRDDSKKTSVKQEDNVKLVQQQIGMTDVMGTDDAKVKYFDDITGDIYIKALVIDTAAPITEEEYALLSKDANNKVLNHLTNENELIEPTVKDMNENQLYSEDDIVRQMFVFDEENMYYMTKYAFVTSKNDNIKDALSAHMNVDKNDYIYSFSFDVTDDGHTNCIAKVDVENSAMSVDFFYSDRNMTYTTKGMIKSRNSFVLKAKKVKEATE